MSDRDNTARNLEWYIGYATDYFWRELQNEGLHHGHKHDFAEEGAELCRPLLAAMIEGGFGHSDLLGQIGYQAARLTISGGDLEAVGKSNATYPL